QALSSGVSRRPRPRLPADDSPPSGPLRAVPDRYRSPSSTRPDRPPLRRGPVPTPPPPRTVSPDSPTDPRAHRTAAEPTHDPDAPARPTLGQFAAHGASRRRPATSQSAHPTCPPPPNSIWPPDFRSISVEAASAKVSAHGLLLCQDAAGMA